MRKLIPVQLLLVGLMGLLLAGCQVGADSEAEEAEEAEPAVPVEATSVSVGDISATYEGTTTLEADAAATVVAKVVGVVLQLNAEEGDYVEAGQVLARLEQDRYRLELQRAKSELDRLQNEYDRKQKLHQRQIISAEDYDRSRYELEAQRAAHGLAKLNYDYTAIRAPISGYISERMVKAGNLVVEHQAVFRIDSFDPLLAVLHVPERELDTLRIGQRVDVALDAYPLDSFVGEVTRISPVVDQSTGTFKVTAEVRDQENRLKSGLFGRVKVIYDRHENVPLVEREAVISEDGEHHVFVIAEDLTVTRRQVHLGFANESLVEIADGLSPGDQVVTAGKGSLKEGSMVEVINGASADIGEPERQLASP